MPLTALQHETSMWSSYGDVVPERPAGILYFLILGTKTQAIEVYNKSPDIPN